MFRSATEGLDYNNVALKDLFYYALDEPISIERMVIMKHIYFEVFVEFLAHRGRDKSTSSLAAASPVMVTHLSPHPRKHSKRTSVA